MKKYAVLLVVAAVLGMATSAHAAVGVPADYVTVWGKVDAERGLLNALARNIPAARSQDTIRDFKCYPWTSGRFRCRALIDNQRVGYSVSAAVGFGRYSLRATKMRLSRTGRSRTVGHKTWRGRTDLRPLRPQLCDAFDPKAETYCSDLAEWFATNKREAADQAAADALARRRTDALAKYGARPAPGLSCPAGTNAGTDGEAVWCATPDGQYADAATATCPEPDLYRLDRMRATSGPFYECSYVPEPGTNGWSRRNAEAPPLRAELP